MKDRIPFFSIVIPAYNASQSIVFTLESIKNQKEKDYEVIIIDDCSEDKDELESVVDSFQLSGMNIKLFLSEKKLNGSGARNKGVELASGKYIALLDADDEWYDTKLSVMRREIDKNKNEDLIYYSKVAIFSEIDPAFRKIMPLRAYEKKNGSIASYLFGCIGFIQTSTIVLKKELYLQIMFDEKFIRHQDYEFCIRADYLGYRFKFVDEILSKYKMSVMSPEKKGETIQYSMNWLNELSFVLTKNDIYTFKAFKLSKKYNGRKCYFIFLINFIFCSLQVKKEFIYSLLLKSKLI
ncbi:glycosyltransferase family 2 protein [Klebsiella sp. RHBSTW-00484]|uniref:glycosyltransferase family 2 protein n=1 Tax=unclassified Klebsiella TaxID=2608929 RepID=UPI0015E4F372|nr:MULTISPECIES: glycosyltransferase family 2 protein [unclassified Klebsiella]QLO36248.1 glycosyltransferase family 2 protein [Klebsiella sp. RHBSTW-00484]QLT75765.1 glycosyltransferase family 2 protein [Klebsiella sp. RHBSTW-00464]HDG7825905.1 glycosyltransferase family 2 protein [Klebsiella quasipneumoniae]